MLADALTSVLAIFALLIAKYVGLIWMDPLTGIIGAILVARWSAGLLRTTGMVLLYFRQDGTQNLLGTLITHNPEYRNSAGAGCG